MKKVIAIILIAAFMASIFMVSGCESAGERFNREVFNMVDQFNREQEAEKVATNSINHLELSRTFDFSEDRAWVEYSEVYNGNWITINVLIDTQGKIIWESDINGDGWSPQSAFKDGLAYMGHYDGYGKSYGVAIIDKDGNITFSKKQDDYMILGYGDGRFLVAEHVSDFDANEWRIGAIDKDGNIVVPFKSYGVEFRSIIEYKYLGGNAFYIRYSAENWDYGSNYIEINIETQSIIFIEDPYKYYEKYYESLTYSEGLKFINGAYYNMKGEAVIEFPAYSGKKYFGDPFCDGYAAMLVYGADGLGYFTIIDKTGTQMFELRNDFDSLYVIDKNYGIATSEDGIHIIDITGKILMTIVSPKRSGELTVSCGVLRIPGGGFLGDNDVYVNIMDGSVIGRIDPDKFSVTIYNK